MSLRSADAVGVSVGQPDRIDQQSEAYQERLRAGAQLEIPKTGIEKPRDGQLENQNRDEHRRNTWAAHEQATGHRGEAWKNGKLENWQKFSGGRNRRDPGRTSGAVVIDAGPSNTSPRVQNAATTNVPPNPNQTEPRRDGWSQMQFAHFKAAKFEEYNRESVNPFMGRRKTATHRRGILVDR